MKPPNTYDKYSFDASRPGRDVDHANCHRIPTDQRAVPRENPPEASFILKYIFPGSETHAGRNDDDYLEQSGFTKSSDVNAWRANIYAIDVESLWSAIRRIVRPNKEAP